ncbi:hypothetical protein C2S53_019489 [Perilla frutescens var. hirtella]|uniref:Ubiquitin-like protease family profile domain-containing protein n=1 Tax=Perilla frutescens var. hirtella TaxID=608512 RepID=A0AAD4JAW6_PERFH|nr:hypothetical protein C2S53_019489 [Perilla frutescens var. hirtella]
MSATSSDNDAVPEANANVLSPPLEGRRNARSSKRKLIFDGASSKTVGCSSSRGDRTPSPFGAGCPVNLHFPLSFMAQAGKRTAAPPDPLLTGRSTQQEAHQTPASKSTSSLAELFPRNLAPEKKFVEAMSMDGRTVLHAQPRHAPASPFSLFCGGGVEPSKGGTDTLEDEFEFLDWYLAPDPVWCDPSGIKVDVGGKHMDAIMHLLVLDLEPHEAPQVRNWTFLDIKCWVALIQPHYAECREILIPYVSGRQPATGSLSWKDAERIFGVGDLGCNHWILYEICQSAELVKVYDPASTEVSPSHVKDTFFSMSYHLPELLEEAGIQSSVPRAHRMRVVNVKSPQQARYCDGGFMVFEYLKCLVSGASVQRADPSNCNRARLRYCSSLFKFGLDWLVKSI